MNQYHHSVERQRKCLPPFSKPSDTLFYSIIGYLHQICFTDSDQGYLKQNVRETTLFKQFYLPFSRLRKRTVLLHLPGKMHRLCRAAIVRPSRYGRKRKMHPSFIKNLPDGVLVTANILFHHRRRVQE